MSIKLADRAKRLKPSASIAAKQIVSDLIAAGNRVVDLTIGEPDFGTPEHVSAAVIEAVRNGDTHYTATPGTLALRKAVVAKFERENGIKSSIENIVVGTGAKQLIFDAFAATVQEKCEVIIPAPYWVSYPDMVTLHGGSPIVVPCPAEVGFKLTPEALRNAITENTTWVVLNTPNNPTGAVYSKEELAALAEVLRENPHVSVMTDEIYEHLVFDGMVAHSILAVAPDLQNRTLVINGVSKAYAMTGLRVGYATGPTDLIAAMVKIIGQSTTCASSIGQAAATAALQGDQSCVAKAAAIYQERRDRMVEILSTVPELKIVVPSGAFYLYVSVQGLIGRTTTDGNVLKTDADVALYLLKNKGVAVLDGSAYGLSPYLRLSFATSLDEIEVGAKAIKEACEELF